MSNSKPQVHVFNPGDDGYEEAGGDTPRRKLGLGGSEGTNLRPPAKPEPLNIGSREARQQWRTYMLKCLEQEMRAHLSARGFELAASTYTYMLRVYDQSLKQAWDLY